MPPVTRDLTAALVEVCDDTLRRLPDGPTRHAVLAVRARLVSPLRIGVAGSVSSGKSTLVNALLGQRIAPVDAGECTRLVTWFCYDHHQRIEVHHRDGSTSTVAFADGTRIPDDLGAPPANIARVVVHLSNDRLRDLTIIDTPGLNTVTDDNERATIDALGLGGGEQEASDSRLAMSDADALLFLTPHVRETDVAVLERFRSLFAASGLSSANVVGVLSKVDRLAPDGDPWPVAQRLATAARDRLSTVVAEVVPVMGLMAETAATDRFTEADGRALAAVARLDELDLEDALLSPQDLLAADVPGVSRDQLRRLLAMLDMHGIGVGVELVRGGARGAAAVLAGLRHRSGLDPLTEMVERGFTRRASALKARGGLSDLRRVAARAAHAEADVVAAMLGPLERIELDPALHDLHILDALRRVEEGAIRLPDDLLDALRRLALETSPALQLGLAAGAEGNEVARAASQAATRWARYANDSRRTPDERRLAEDVRECYELVWDQAAPAPAVVATPARAEPAAPASPSPASAPLVSAAPTRPSPAPPPASPAPAVARGRGPVAAAVGLPRADPSGAAPHPPPPPPPARTAVGPVARPVIGAPPPRQAGSAPPRPSPDTEFDEPAPGSGADHAEGDAPPSSTPWTRR